jgi:hypothetical protein
MQDENTTITVHVEIKGHCQKFATAISTAIAIIILVINAL